MAANGYFQVVAEDGRMWLKIFAPEEGEVDISPEMVMKYLDAISFPDYDQVALDQYLKRKEFDSMFMLYEGEIIPESRKMYCYHHAKWRARICTVLSADYRGRKLDRR